MAIRLDTLFNTGEQIILDSSIRGRGCNNWLKNLYRISALNDADQTSLTLAKQSVLDAFSDYIRNNTLTVGGAVRELRNYANAVRKKKLDFEQDQDPREDRIHPVIQELMRIHTGILALADIAKTKLYDSKSPQYRDILDVIRGIYYSTNSRKPHRRETDLQVVTAGIHSANYVPTHVVSKDFDITRLVRKYTQGRSTPHSLACYFMVSDSEAERTV
ncbi:Uncharacterised protein [uncultured archaeon]|nr:Uncharacterised protein [uncultured archaeon]